MVSWGLFQPQHEPCLWKMKAGKELRKQRAILLLVLDVPAEYIAFGGFFTTFLTQFLLYLPSFHKSVFCLPFLSFLPMPSFFPSSVLPQYTGANEVIPQIRINSKWWLHCCFGRYCIDPHLDPSVTTGSSGMLHCAAQCVLISAFEEICKYFGCTGESIRDWSQINHFDLTQNLSEYSITKYCHC